MPTARLIWIGFERNGPFLRLDKCQIGDASLGIGEGSTGDADICENFSYASVTFPVAYFSPEEDGHQCRKNLKCWLEQAKDVYRQKHVGEPVIFR